MGVKYSITDSFGVNLAELLSEKIVAIYAEFPADRYCHIIKDQQDGKTYTERVVMHANALQQCLPADFDKATATLLKILGPENPHETGMFTNYYWLMPVGKFVQLYGLENFDTSIKAIEEITKRNTGEYAVRPFIERYPQRMINVMTKWAQSDNFHLRRLASEGLRPKLPWAPKLDVFVADPEPVFNILEILKEDNVKFVQRSVANHLRDYLKVNPSKTEVLFKQWQKSTNPHTQWIIKHAKRGNI